MASNRAGKEQIIQAYIDSGKSITDYCKDRPAEPESKKLGTATLLGWLEEKGYKMVLETTSGTSGRVMTSAEYDELKAENEKLMNSYSKLLQKYEAEKYRMALMACVD